MLRKAILHICLNIFYNTFLMKQTKRGFHVLCLKLKLNKLNSFFCTNIPLQFGIVKVEYFAHYF